jgi:hypothetical protein
VFFPFGCANLRKNCIIARGKGKKNKKKTKKMTR